MKPYIHNSDSNGRAMLDLVDDLRKISSVSENIPLPQIIVIGVQSAGKSSLLNAISGLNFPTSSDITTRFATEIVQRRAATPSCRTYIKYEESLSHSDPQLKARLDDFSTRWPSARLLDLHEFKDVIENAQDALELTDRDPFSTRSLVIEIEGPEQEHLTLIDLPGFVVSLTKEQNPQNAEAMNAHIEKYMSNQRSVIMAVFKSSEDFANQITKENLQLSKDKYRHRTIGVLTSPDKVDSAQKAQTLIDIVQANSEEFGLGHGWHVVRSLSDDEKADNMNREIVEQEFFENRPFWRLLPETMKGAHSLRAKLSKILRREIGKSLPLIRKEIEAKQNCCKKDLNILGSVRETSDQQREFLKRAAEEYTSKISGAFDSTLDSLKIEQGRSSVQSHIRKAGDKFCVQMLDKGQTWKIDHKLQPVASISQDRWKVIENAMTGASTSQVIISQQEAAEYVQSMLNDKRGRQLPGAVHSGWVGKLFKLQSRQWHNLAMSYLEDVLGIVDQFMKYVSAKIFEGPVRHKIYQNILKTRLMEFRKTLEDKLNELLRPYRNDRIYTLSHRYSALKQIHLLAREQGLSAQPNRTLTDAACDILNAVDAFYDISLEVFTENVDALIIENCLLSQLQDTFTVKQVESWDEQKLHRIAGESEGSVQRRKALHMQVSHYQDSLDLLSNYEMDEDLFWTEQASGFDSDFAEGYHMGAKPTTEHLSHVTNGFTTNVDAKSSGPAVKIEAANIEPSTNTAQSSTQSHINNAQQHLQSEPFTYTPRRLSSRKASPGADETGSRTPRTPDRRVDAGGSSNISSPFSSRTCVSEGVSTAPSSVSSGSPKEQRGTNKSKGEFDEISSIGLEFKLSRAPTDGPEL